MLPASMNDALRGQASLPEILKPLNEALMPALRLGIANPLPLTSGLVLLEVIGRKSGRVSTVPLVCTDYGELLAVSTVRNNSQWVRNLAANPNASIWLRGRQLPVTAAVFSNGERLDESSIPDDLTGRIAQTLSGSGVISIALLHRQ